MLAALRERRHERPALFEQLLHALQRDRCIAREISRLSPVLSGAPPRSARDEHLFASVVTLMLLLDSAADLRLWQLLAEADVARTVYQVHLIFPEAPAVSLPRLVEGEHTLQRPLGRAAASFVGALHDFEKALQRMHPLMTGVLSAGAEHGVGCSPHASVPTAAFEFPGTMRGARA